MIEISQVAKADMLAAYQWYLDRNPGAAHRFMEQLERLLWLIGERPTLFPRISGRVRRARMRAYPYDLFFMIDADGFPRVIAVLHERRDPIVWQSRM